MRRIFFSLLLLLVITIIVSPTTNGFILGPSRAPPHPYCTRVSSFSVSLEAVAGVLESEIDEKQQVLGSAFLVRLKELKAYMAENNGSCMVPRRGSSLGIWINKTRANYQKYLKGESTSLTSERIAALNEIGFVWVATGKNRRTPEKAALWNTRYEEMKQFHSRFGHCNVPSNYLESPLLQNWMFTQKLQYRNKCQGKYSMLTQDRIDALNMIGFEWDDSRWDQLWHQRYEQLCQYKKEHGHCEVPISYADNRQLAVWVSRQRREYKRLIQGKSSYMSKKRQQMLEQVGFVWSILERGWHDTENDVL